MNVAAGTLINLYLQMNMLTFYIMSCINFFSCKALANDYIIIEYQDDKNADTINRIHSNKVPRHIYKPTVKDSLDYKSSAAIFPQLQSLQVKATAADEQVHSYLLRVTHTRSHATSPHLCTAVALENRIFITALRCLLRMQVSDIVVTRLASKIYRAEAFVYPSTKMATSDHFRDIAFIVARREDVNSPSTLYRYSYIPIQTEQWENRRNEFGWFDNLKLHKDPNVQVKGFARSSHDFHFNPTGTELYSLPVNVSRSVCTQLLGAEYNVPCYHVCGPAEQDDFQCHKYLGPLGGAVVRSTSNKLELLGIVTWGPTLYPGQNEHFPPVGFSPLRSLAFMENYQCAKAIRDKRKYNCLSVVW